MLLDICYMSFFNEILCDQMINKRIIFNQSRQDYYNKADQSCHVLAYSYWNFAEQGVKNHVLPIGKKKTCFVPKILIIVNSWFVFLMHLHKAIA